MIGRTTALTFLFGCGISAGVASARDVSVVELNTWLCKVLTLPSPGDQLGTFPGAPGGTVTTDHGTTKVTTLRSGRTVGGNPSYRWRYNNGGYRITYGYQKHSTKGDLFGYRLKIEGPSSGDSLILKSDQEARGWLSGMAEIRRGTEDGSDQVCARGSYDGDASDYEFKACVDVEMQEIEIEWMDPDDLPLDRICGR
jgi:hypothetical protein